MAYLWCHRAVRDVCLGRGSDLDKIDVADAGGDSLHLFYYPRGLPDWPGDRQRHWGNPVPEPPCPPARPSRLSVPIDRCGRLDRPDDLAFDSLLAYQPRPDTEPLPKLPTRFRPLPLGSFARPSPVGCKFSAGPGGR